MYFKTIYYQHKKIIKIVFYSLTEFLYSTLVEFPTIEHTWQQWQRDISISPYKFKAIKYDMIH